jgi:V/A-type H+-transporting ATPase subunit E
MNGIENIIEHIQLQSDIECEEIVREAVEECERIRAEYARKEQDEYWKHINIGAKETERRLGQLGDLADQEAKKQIDALHREMVTAAFDLAITKLLELPEHEYTELLVRHDVNTDCSAADLISKYKEELTPHVISALFD